MVLFSKKKKKKEPDHTKKEVKAKTVTHFKKQKTVNPNLAEKLENEDLEKLNQPIIKDLGGEIDKTNYQHFNDLIEDPHVHSQGFVSTKQGVSVLFDDVVQNNIIAKEEKKNSEKVPNQPKKPPKSKQ